MSFFSRTRVAFSQLPRQEQGIALLLLSIGSGALIFGFFSFSAFAKRPFELQIAELAKKGRYESLDAQALREKEEQKERDTDGDTLNDYDELMIFKTSPYLKDTDSDGIDDATETLSGDNPNCPRGKSCELLIQLPASELPGGLTAPATDPKEALQQLLIATSAQPKDPATLIAALESLSVKELRELALSSGVPKEQVETLSDTDLRQRFLEALSQARVDGSLQVDAETAQTTP